jgi:UDP-2,3-diacylglucosamine pyrophosphatase LpxH
MRHKPLYNTIFISDLHLGSAGARADYVLKFLKAHPCKKVYLVGDIFDFWVFPRSGRWNKSITDLMRYILKIAKTTDVIYIPGNHDEVIREYTGSWFDSISVKLQDVHYTSNGKKFLVLHGDEADSTISLHPKLARVGSFLYEASIVLNMQVNRIRSLLKLKNWSFSEWLKYKVKDAVKYVNRFEEVIIKMAVSNNCDGVICGHIHTPALYFHKDSDILYVNCGDWISNFSAIVEEEDGNLKLIRYQP